MQPRLQNPANVFNFGSGSYLNGEKKYNIFNNNFNKIIFFQKALYYMNEIPETLENLP